MVLAARQVQIKILGLVPVRDRIKQVIEFRLRQHGRVLLVTGELFRQGCDHFLVRQLKIFRQIAELIFNYHLSRLLIQTGQYEL